MNNEPKIFERYKPLIDDWAAFTAAMSRPLPVCIWTNTLRISAEDLAREFKSDGFKPRQIAWKPTAFRLAGNLGVGGRWWYLAGLGHAQEEVSMLPVTLLEPQPGERILDMCAAPGGKTAQIAVALGNRGTVVANDISFNRMRPLRAVVERLGLVNVSTTNYDGANFPSSGGPFDRVLVDAPCSGEGIWRKNGGLIGGCSEQASLQRHRAQKALLRRGIELCRPGGRIVYSTCTFAPEENEMVVDALLREYDGLVDLVDAHIAGFVTCAGTTAWGNHSFREDLHKTLRIWPHHNDTGGFFIAVMQKRGPAAQHTPVYHELTPGATSDYLSQITHRFDIPESVWGGLQTHRQTTRGLHLVNAEHQAPLRPKPDAIGLYFFHTKIKPPKLTTAAAMLIGRHARRNFIDVNTDQAQNYLACRSFRATRGQTQHCSGSGHILVRYQSYTLGVAFYQQQTGEVRSLFPKHWNGRTLD